MIQITYFTRRYLNRYSLLIKGGIVKGDHFIKDDIIVSPALAKAAVHEKKAKFPIIIIEYEEAEKLKNKVIENFDNQGVEGIFINEFEKYLRFEREYITKDELNNYIMHPVHGVDLKGYIREGRFQEIQTCVDFFRNYRDFLNSNWQKNCNAEDKIKEKFIYLIAHLNSFVEQNAQYVPPEQKINI